MKSSGKIVFPMNEKFWKIITFYNRCDRLTLSSGLLAKHPFTGFTRLLSLKEIGQGVLLSTDNFSVDVFLHLWVGSFKSFLHMYVITIFPTNQESWSKEKY